LLASIYDIVGVDISPFDNCVPSQKRNVSIPTEVVEKKSDKKWKKVEIGFFELARTFQVHFQNFCLLSRVATVVFNVRLLHAVVFSKQLRWLEPTKVITLKTQTHAVNAR
jgi:hypothetical protein